MSANRPAHQTIRLGRGRHASPAEGACVMELASMLASEPFSDHPVSVCPVIGSLLRAYNDTVDDDRRQDLYACAAAVVGTNGSQAARSARAARMADWTDERRRRLGLLSRLSKGLQRVSLNHLPTAEHGGTLAVLAIGRPTGHAHDEVLALIRDLVDIDDAGSSTSADKVLASVRDLVDVDDARSTTSDVATEVFPPSRHREMARPVASP